MIVSKDKNQFTNIIDGIKVTFRQALSSEPEKKSEALQELLIRVAQRKLAK